MKVPAKEAFKAAEHRAKAHIARQRQIALLKRQWVAGSEMTAQQLADFHAALKQDYLSRHPEHAVR